MTYLELRNFLVHASSVETVDLFDYAIEVFDSYNLDDYLNIFDDTLGVNDKASDQTIMDLLLENVVSISDSILSEHGIIFNQDTMLRMKLDTCSALLSIENYIDKWYLYYTCDSAQNPEEALSEVLQMLTPYSCEEYLSFIESVGSDLIDRIKEICKPEDDKEIENTSLTETIGVYRKYKELINGQSSYSDSYISNISSIGLDYATYLDSYSKSNKELIESTQVKDMIKVANDLIGLAILAKKDKPYVMMVRQAIKTITDNVRTAIEIDTASTKILLNL